MNSSRLVVLCAVLAAFGVGFAVWRGTRVDEARGSAADEAVDRRLPGGDRVRRDRPASEPDGSRALEPDSAPTAAKPISKPFEALPADQLPSSPNFTMPDGRSAEAVLAPFKALPATYGEANSSEGAVRPNALHLFSPNVVEKQLEVYVADVKRRALIAAETEELKAELEANWPLLSEWVREGSRLLVELQARAVRYDPKASLGPDERLLYFRLNQEIEAATARVYAGVNALEAARFSVPAMIAWMAPKK